MSVKCSFNSQTFQILRPRMRVSFLSLNQFEWEQQEQNLQMRVRLCDTDLRLARFSVEKCNDRFGLFTPSDLT